MNYHITCEHCGVWLSDHDHEHLARECYPKQIKALEDAAHAQMTTILVTIGGYVEGKPVGPHNYLQRLRNLVAAEDIVRRHAHLENSRDRN